MNKVADALASSESSTVFTGDNDPELVGDALPFAIKLYETLMVSNPKHLGLKLNTGSIYIMYANAFLHSPADMLSEEEYKKQEFMIKRAKNLYLRGRNMILDALEIKYPGFVELLNNKNFKKALSPMKKTDISFLYWAGLGWMGAFSVDPFDMKLGLTLPGAAALSNKVEELDINFKNGAIHDFYILYYGSIPEYMGGDLKKARLHFQKAVEKSGGKLTSPFLSLATSVSVKEQNLKEFRMLLNKVIKIDPDADLENRLLNILNIRKAVWLLEHYDNFFLVDNNEENE